MPFTLARGAARAAIETVQPARQRALMHGDRVTGGAARLSRLAAVESSTPVRAALAARGPSAMAGRARGMRYLAV